MGLELAPEGDPAVEHERARAVGAPLLEGPVDLSQQFDVLPPDWDAPKMTKDADRRLARLLHLVLSLPEAQLG